MVRLSKGATTADCWAAHVCPFSAHEPLFLASMVLARFISS